MRIGIDVDGCLAMFNESLAKLLIETTGRHLLPPEPVIFPCWDWPEYFGYTKAEISATWDHIVEDPTFWYMLYPYDGSSEFLLNLDNDNHDIYFITSRLGVRAKKQTENWLKIHGFLYFPTVLISGDKGAICKALDIDLYIDDRTENCLDVNHTSPRTRTLMLARPWNTTQSGIPRVESFDQFAAFINST